MTKKYCDIVELNSTMLGKILLNMDDDMARNFGVILKVEKVKKFFADEELVQTVQVFLENDLNIIKASKMLNVHRNTMIYRLEKIKKLLGLDIKTFEDAVTIQIILTIKNINKKRKKIAKRSLQSIEIQKLTQN